MYVIVGLYALSFQLRVTSDKRRSVICRRGTRISTNDTFLSPFKSVNVSRLRHPHPQRALRSLTRTHPKMPRGRRNACFLAANHQLRLGKSFGLLAIFSTTSFRFGVKSFLSVLKILFSIFVVQPDSA